MVSCRLKRPWREPFRRWRLFTIVRRYQLSQVMLGSILMVKLNNCLIESINNEDILKIKTYFEENPSEDET